MNSVVFKIKNKRKSFFIYMFTTVEDLKQIEHGQEQLGGKYKCSDL
jgi:hypothetical protein